jgi:hypothetical protein
MTAFAPANIPSSVTTLEEVAAWAISALAEINPAVTIQTSAGSVERAVQAQTFEFRNQATNPERLILVAYLPLSASWRSSGKYWGNGIVELSTAPLPSGYTSN